MISPASNDYRVHMHTAAEDATTASELRGLVEACLNDMDSLIAGYLEQLHSIEGYANADIPAQDLLDTTRDGIELILRKAANLPLAPRLETASDAIGRRRAAQGVPLELLLQAVRMVFRLLWTTLHNRATPAQVLALDRSAVQLWEAIEFHTVRVHAGYLDELSRMRRDRETEISILLSGFLERNRPDTATTMQVARTLGVISDDNFLVAASPLTTLDLIRSRVSGSEIRAQLHVRSDSILILIPDARPDSTLVHPGAPPLAWAEGVLTAVAPTAVGLAAVPGAWRVAHDLLIAAPTGYTHTITLKEGWPSLVARAMPELAAAIGGDTLHGLGALAGPSRDQLLRTVEVYLRSGSLSETSRLLFVHRNTVLKRLARFTELTGLDPSIPWDAATIRIALSTDDHGRSDNDGTQ